MRKELSKTNRNRYLLTLYRQRIVSYNGESSDGAHDTNLADSDADVKREEHADSENKVDKNKAFFVTDYFDKLEVTEIEATQSLAAFTGIECQETFTSTDVDLIAVHRYAVYQDINNNRKAFSVFENNNEFPYLGLIHVYITADVLDKLSVQNGTKSFIEYFEEDLQQTITHCSGVLEICGEVFRMLSGSDFIIAVRAHNPKDVLSTTFAIRKRWVCKKEDMTQCLFAYKTYTILTLDGDGIVVEAEKSKSDTSEVEAKKSKDEKQEEESDAVIFRGRFSNDYWEKKKAVERDREKSLAEVILNPPDALTYLHGRYDFLIRVSLSDFLKQYSLWQRVKKIKKDEEKVSSLQPPEEMSRELLYLYELIQMKGLSYLNERYLIGAVEDVYDRKNSEDEDRGFTDIVQGVFLEQDADLDKYMYTSNKKDGVELVNTIKDMKKSFLESSQAYPSITESLDLLVNLIGVCDQINALSDARSYVAPFLKQIEVVLESFKRWQKLYQKSNAPGILSLAEEYLMTSVAYLEEYGGLIRSNNFQTLQAPTYSVIRGITMEKLLLGYSRFFSTVINFCSKQLEEKSESQSKCYFPVMIPKFGQDAFTVEVLFPDWKFSVNSAVEAQNVPKKEQYLMVVTCPITKLMDLKYTVPTLFHEMAHSIRYESRIRRNIVLYKLMLEDIANTLNGQHFIMAVDSETTIKNTYLFQEIFIESYIDAFENALPSIKEQAYRDQSLVDYKYGLIGDIVDFFSLLARDYDSLRFHVQGLVDTINEYLNEEGIAILTALAKSVDTLEGQKEKKKLGGDEWKKFKKDWEENPEEVSNRGVNQPMKDIEKFENWCIVNVPCDIIENVRKMIKALREHIDNENTTFISYEDKKKINDFYESVYNDVCDKWQKKIKRIHKNPVETLPERKVWLKQGRKFGVDEKTEGNKENFIKTFKKTLKLVRAYHMDSMIANAVKRIDFYREQTADLFMCNMCQLDICGYLTVFAYMKPSVNGRYDVGYIDRLTDVILMQWGLEDKNNLKDQLGFKSEKREKEICGDALFGKVWRALNEAEDQISQKIETLEDMKRHLENYAKNDVKGERKRILRRDVAILAYQILEKIDDRIDWFEKRSFLVEDYLRGKEAYGALRREFEERAGKPITEENRAMKDIIELCNINREILSTLDCQEGDDIEIQYNKQCVDFLMSNLYYDKIQNAKGGE